jgi:nucleoside-diphosphate-sugar epimerase
LNILITGCCGVVGRAIARLIKLSKHYSDARIIGSDVFQYWYALHEPLFDGI